MSDSPSPTPAPREGGIPPVVMDIPTLGRAVRLGELYDQRSGKFLGVQLYAQDQIKEVVTDIKHTELSLSLSTTHEEKASVLDINAQLSLEIIKISGSASYLNDQKSNTHESSFVMALKMRLAEKRIPFAEEYLGRKVLQVAKDDYIKTKQATHFVSSIVYGGNFIINLVARQSELTKEEKISGNLQGEFNKLKGAIDLSGNMDASIKDQFKVMSNKFDLVIHGDVALKQVPTNPMDVLDTFPKAAELIGVDGVPISVTLQPIPAQLEHGDLVYQLDAVFLDEILKAFSMLDDLRSRFQVLLDRTKKSMPDFVPELVRTTRVVAATYAQEHSKLLHEFAKFLQDFKRGTPLKSDSVFTDSSADITGDKVLEQARDLYKKHLDPAGKDPKVSSQYPSSLAGLENELERFQNFLADVGRVRKSLQKPDEPVKDKPAEEEGSIYMCSIEEICRAMKIHSRIPVFVMIPLTGDDRNSDLTAVQYLATLRRHAGYFKDPANPAYMLYAEDLGKLESRLPNDGSFSRLTKPSLFIGEVDSEGNLTWGPPPAPMFDLRLNHQPSDQKLGDLFFDINTIDASKTFSLQISAKAPSAAPPSPESLLDVRNAENKSTFLHFTILPLRVNIASGAEQSFVMALPETVPKTDSRFMLTFVQDTATRQWHFYFRSESSGDQADVHLGQAMSPSEVKKLQVAFASTREDLKWWSGELYEIKAFARALTKEEVDVQYLEWESRQAAH